MGSGLGLNSKYAPSVAMTFSSLDLILLRVCSSCYLGVVGQQVENLDNPLL